MGLLESWGEFFGRQTAGGIRRFGFPFTEAYLKAWCNVQQKYPRLVGLSGYHRGFVSGVCPAVGFPDPPLPPYPPYEEGKCPGVQYDVTINITRVSAVGQSQTYTSGIHRLYGSIEFIGVVKVLSGNDEIYRTRVVGYDETGNEKTLSFSVVGVGGVAYMNRYNIQRTDGLPHDPNCYNPIEDFPPDPPIDPDDFNPVIPIPRVDDNDDPLPPLEVPVIININPNVDFNIDINTDTDEYYFDDDGFNRRTPTPAPPRNSPPPIDSPKVSPLPPIEDIEDVAEEEVQEGTELLYVLVTVTVPPYKGKTITYVDATDVTYFAGYFHWLVPGNTSYRLPEIPIRKQNNGFQAPPGTTGYRIIAVNGAKMVAQAYTIEVENS